MQSVNKMWNNKHLKGNKQMKNFTRVNVRMNKILLEEHTMAKIKLSEIFAQ